MADTARDEEFYYLLTEGSELLQAGKVDDARKHFERALEIQSGHEQALNLLGLSLFRLNQLDRARQIFTDLVHNNPIEPSLRLNLAMVHLKTGKTDDAKIELERVLELSPDHPRATSYMGLVLERKGEMERAADYYERAGNKKRADEIRAFRPTATGTFPIPNLKSMVNQPSTLPPGPIAMASQPSPPSPAAVKPPPPPTSTPPPAPPPLPKEHSGTSVPAMPAPHSKPSAPSPRSPTGSMAAVDVRPPAPPPLPSAATSASVAASEAAALTAASASQLRRASDPPLSAQVDTARAGSLGFTLEVGDKKNGDVQRAMRASSLQDLIVAHAPGDEQPRSLGKTLSFPVNEVGYVRTDRLVSFSGPFTAEAVFRRYRGKRTDSLFGGTDGALIALSATTPGSIVIDVDNTQVEHLALKNEELYLVESMLLAFTQGLVWENGRLPSEADKDLDIVHLRGTGRLAMGTPQRVLGLTVRPEAPVTVHANRLVGWNGALVPYRSPLAGVAQNARRVPVVRFEGTGTVFAF